MKKSQKSKGTTSKNNEHLERRRFMKYFFSIGLASILLPVVLWSKLRKPQEDKKLTIGTLKEATKISGLEFTETELEMMLEGLNQQLKNYQKLRSVPLANDVPSSLGFDPIMPGMTFPETQHPLKISQLKVSEVPTSLESVAFWSVTKLSQLVKTRKVTSLKLTRMYLSRLKRYDEKLKCVVTLTEKLALKQAKQADREIASGNYRGPLHGIPWGVKDLFAMRGYQTTWGAKPYQNQVIDKNATVIERLEEAGAVLVAKLTLGALASGDVWYGGQTKNPWNLNGGSSGSSAGSSAAVACGLVGFSIGTETLGSIVSPATVCGVTGLRPTFGRVSRYGAMSLSWSMDKIGPICRSVEDCALVFDVIHGSDNRDGTVKDLPFNWDPDSDIHSLKIGYVESSFAKAHPNDQATLKKLREMGLNLVSIQLPDYPVETMEFILSVEAAAAFDELTRSNQDDLLTRQTKDAWPNIFRRARMIPAVEYVQANRLRWQVMDKMAELMSDIDLYVTPSFDSLLLTNLTGHPCVVLPNGFEKTNSSDVVPTSISFIGQLYGEAKLMTAAKAYQDITGFHLNYPQP